MPRRQITCTSQPVSRSKPLPEVSEADDEPMRIWPHPIQPPCCDGAQSCTPSPCGSDQVLEQLCCQNQLLTDLLGAVNALTAAVLSMGGKS